MATAFAAGEAPGIAQLGFDDESVPPWIMVPAEPDAQKRVVVLKDGAGLALQLRPAAGSANPSGVLRFQEQTHPSGRGIVLAPIAPGTVFLDAKDQTGGVRASLEITVKAHKTLKTAMFRISDKVGRRPSRPVNDIEQQIVIANKLLVPQINVRIAPFFHRGLQMHFEMPTGMPTIYNPFRQANSWDRNTPGPLACVSSRPPGPFADCVLEDRLIPPMRGPEDLEAMRRTQMLINIVFFVDPSMDYNIFHVKVLDQHPGDSQGRLTGFTAGFTPNKVDGAAINACFVQDSALTGQTIAHELSHFLTSPKPAFLDKDGHSFKRGDLLFRTPGPLDIKIPKQQANLMNRSGVP
jgi:hypothetical protein